MIDANAGLCRRGEVIASSYLLGDVLGVGGMGVVYSAVQRSLDRVVAVKLPRPELVDDALVRAQLRSEAFAGAAVNHRNIVHVLDFGTEDGVPFVVMEYVVGPRLSQLLNELGPMPVATALMLARQIVDGLEDVHANGIVHADVKCDNILVEVQRNSAMIPRLIDFGIARFTEAPQALDPMVTGTPEYLAPEVICGQAPTFSADVYAVGVLLYELVTGHTPFAGGTSMQVMTRRLEEQVVPIALRCPDREIPAAFDALVMRALDKEPAARFADAHELGVALDALLPPRPDDAVAEPPLDKPHDRFVVRYLDRARELVEAHCLAAAITQLEEGIARLAALPEPNPVWRLQLTLAALYDGIGSRSRARLLTTAARHRAHCAGSATGCARADLLAVRLGRRGA